MDSWISCGSMIGASILTLGVSCRVIDSSDLLVFSLLESAPGSTCKFVSQNLKMG